MPEHPTDEFDRAVYFDCDGTLVEHDRPYGRLVRDAARREGVPGGARERFVEAYGPAFFEAFEAFDPAPIRTAVTAALDEAGVGDAVDGDGVADAIRDLDVEATVLRPDATAAVSAAAECGGVGVLTNGVTDLQRRKLVRHDLFERLDAYVPSYEIGSHKPSPAIFAAARQQLPAASHAYVGDDRESDVEPACEADFRAIHVGDEGETSLAAVARSPPLSQGR